MIQTVTELEAKDFGGTHAEVEYKAFYKTPTGLRIGTPRIRIRVTKGEWVTIDPELLTYTEELYGVEE